MFLEAFVADSQFIRTVFCLFGLSNIFVRSAPPVFIIVLSFFTEYIDQGKEQIALSPRYPGEFQDSNDERKTGFDSIVNWNAPRTY